MPLFFGGLTINAILWCSYLEHGPRGAIARPWVWIIWLFIIPVSNSIAFQWCCTVMRTTIVRVEALVTRLLFEHSLRMRVTASTAEPSATVGDLAEFASDAATLSAAASVSETAETDVGADVTTTTSVPTPDVPSPPAKTKSTNVMGKLNNLVSQAFSLLA